MSIVNLIRGSVLNKRIPTLFVVKANPLAKAMVEFGTAVKGEAGRIAWAWLRGRKRRIAVRQFCEGE